MFCSYYDNFGRFPTLSRPAEESLATVETKFSAFSTLWVSWPDLLQYLTWCEWAFWRIFEHSIFANFREKRFEMLERHKNSCFMWGFDRRFCVWGFETDVGVSILRCLAQNQGEPTHLRHHHKHNLSRKMRETQW